jgi:uncharacterized protein (DUF1499 family)
MNKVLIIFTLIIISIVILIGVFAHNSKSGKAAGLVDGRLVKCHTKPNCVCSEQKDDTDHYIEPIIILQITTDETSIILKETIQELGGTMQTETGTYIAATFSSAVFGFIDDLEIRIDSAQNVIHIRSASRIGHSDFGVNRKRTELVKDLYYKKANKG